MTRVDNAELEQIVQRMIDANEPEANIAAVIEQYAASKASNDIAMKSDGGMAEGQVQGVNQAQEDALTGNIPEGSTEPTSILEAVAPGHNDWASAIGAYGKAQAEKPKSSWGERRMADLRATGKGLEDAWNVTAHGFLDFVENTGQLVEGLQLGAYELMTPGELTADEKRAKLIQIQATNFASSFTTGVPSSLRFKEVVDSFEEKLPEYENASLTEDIRDGNYAQAAKRTVEGALASLPSVLAAYTGVGGFFALGVSTSGGKFEEEFEKDPTRNTANLLLNATATGTTEAAFEMVTRGLLKKARLLSGNGMVKEAEEFLAKSSWDVVKSLGGSIVAEGASEAATELTVALIDAIPNKYGVGLDNVEGLAWENLKYRLGDAAVIGSFVGGGIEGVGVANRSLRGENETQRQQRTKHESTLMHEGLKNQIVDSAEKINKLAQDLVDATPEGKKAINKQIELERNEIIKLRRKNSVLLSNIKGEDLKTYAKNIEEINKVKQLHRDATTDSEKAIAQETYLRLNKENAAIIKKAAGKELSENISKIRSIAKDIYGDDLEIKEFTAKEAQDFINKDPNIADEAKESLAAEALLSQGFFHTVGKDGQEYLVINKDVASETYATNVAGHEFLHKALDATFKNNPDIQVAVGEALKSTLESMDATQVSTSEFVDRLKAYKDKTKGMQAEEVLTILSDSLQSGDLKFDETIYTKIGDVIRRALQDIGIKGVRFDTGRDVYNFIKDYNRAVAKGKVKGSIKKAAVEGVKGDLVDGAGDVKGTKSESDSKFSKGLKESTRKIVAKNEEIYQRIVDAAKVKNVKISKDLVTQDMKDELVENNLARASALSNRAARVAKNLNLDESLKIDNASDWFQEYSLKLAELANTWDPSKNDSFGAYMNQLLPKKYSGILESLKNDLETSSIDTNEGTRARAEAIETESDTNQRPDTRRKKTNVLKIGNVERKAVDIKKAVEVNEGDTFKEVSDLTNINGNTAKVGEIIFDVPGKKILDRNEEGKSISANLTYAKKIVNGIPEASEAGNIQSFYNQPQTIDKLLKILPPENVSSSDADINEIGENIDVDRDVLGRGLGLNNKVLNYFYDKTNKRSQGLKSQPFIWKLKPEFKNPTPKVIQQFQDDLGITPRGELNNYNRDIGQLLKGMAKFQAQQTALSTAQRILTERKAPKKQIASVTAAQSKTAFSKAMEEVDLLPANPEFDMDGVTHVDDVLASIGQKGIYRHRSKVEIDQWFEGFERDIIANTPENVLPKSRLNTILRPSNRIFPGKKFGLQGKGKDMIDVDGKQMSIDAYYDIKRKELLKKDLKYGKPFEGEGAKYVYGRTYGDIFGKTEAQIKKSFDDGTVDRQNKINLSMHRQLWERINKSIEDTGGKSARAWGSWLSFVGQDTEHPHRMGAELLGYSLNPVGTKNKKGKVKLYEWEHAMPATKAYLYLLKSATSEEFGFKSSYDLVMDNFKLIALDGAQDLKLKNSGRTTSMGAEWSILTDSWLDRYFHEDVVAVRGGIDPNSIIGFDGKAFGEIFNINAEGVDPAFESARDIEARDKDSKVMDQAFKASRSSTKPKGITVLDFDDTLATTKSNVLYTAPDGTTGTLNAEEFAKQGGDLLAQGVKFDFSEFNKVVKGETAPLFNKAMKLYGKFGAENMFILTARAPESQLAIKQFLDAQGLKIPLKNITGLGKSEASAKANWIAEKVGEGYNDFYFADDAIQNVDAVREKLDELQVKNKVQQAKTKFSMNTKRDLSWKSTDRVTFTLDGKRVTEGKIYNAGFKVGDNDYIIRLTNRPLSVNFDQGVVSGKSAFDLEFSLENQADELWEGAGKMGVEGTGRASEVLSIVSNGVMDFIKNNDVDAIGFSSADTSRTRLYNTLTKFWASRLGWEWTSQTFKPDKRTGEDFTGGKFIISNPNATKPIVEAPVANESDFSNRSTEEKNMLNMFDIKGKVRRARIKFSKSGPKKMSDIIDEGELDLNAILEQSKGVGKNKTFSAAKARQRGKNKGKFKFFVPPSADDFAGLMYSFMGRGKQGNKHHAWFKENLFDPFSKGMRRHKTVQQQVANDMRNLRKAMPDVRKKLGKKVPGTEYTHEDAIRIYNWSQAGLDIPGLSQTDATALIDAVESDAKLLAFAQGVNSISNTPGGMVDPGPHWTGGNIALDLKEALDNARSTNLQQWIENKNIIFSEANMNKIEAVYGSNFREALEDSLYRMETGSTQNVGKDRLLGNFTAWIHGSIGTTMFLNARSAMLQMISNVNFVNWSDNNMLKAAGAFANQKQYWKDVSMIFNSPFLKQRRSGIQTDVNAAELLAQIKDSKNKLKAATAHLLQLGFTPTQIADSFAIATGGATFYRNRIKTYLKEGMTQAEAETKAFEDMMEIAEETQQSTRADKISQQQASPIGKFLLAFQNTPMQYNRLIKKAAQDLVNGRGDPKANISRIVYYGGIQNLIFYGLQTALFAALFSDDEEDDITGKKTERVVNGMVDTLLRGSGIGGAVVSTVKNVIMKFMKESEKMDDGVYYTDPDWGNVVIEALNISPPIGIKARKIYSGLKTWEYNKDVIDTMDKTDVDNPIYDAVASVTEAVTNVPLSRMYNKFQNISEALNSDHDTWKRVAMLLGWSKWSFGIKNQDVIDAKGEAKIIKAAEKKEGNRNTFVDDQKKEKDEGKKDITCAASTRSGGRCSNKVVGGGSHCTVHEKVKQNDTGKKTQCTHVKSDGKRCKMKTNSKSGKCYYHD